MVESALYILAGIALYGGAHQLYLAAQRGADHPHILHGAMYLLLCAFALSSALTYRADSVAVLISTGKLSVTSGLLLWGTLAWFVAACARFRPRLPLAALSVAWSMLLIGNIGAPYSLLYSEVTPVRQMLPGGELQTALQSTLNPWWTVAQLAMLASLLFALYATFKLHRAKHTRAALALGCGLLVLTGATISDALVNTGQIQSAYLAPFGFLVLLAAVSIQPGLRAPRKASQTRETPASYNMTFHLNQPPVAARPVFAQAPARTVAPVDIEHESQAEIGHAANEPAFNFDIDEKSIEPVSQQPSGEATHPQPARSSDAEGVNRLDEAALTEVSDNLIDIAVYATMAMNRFKRGEASAESLEDLFNKVRKQAINTRRIANRMMRTPQDTDRTDDNHDGQADH